MARAAARQTLYIAVNEWVETYQLTHQAPRREIALQEMDQVPAWKEDGTSEDDDSRLWPNCFVESVETRCWEDETTNIGQVRQSIYRE